MKQKVFTIIASKRFFYVIVIFFFVQTAWIALTGRYPMAFDEDFHLGIIRIYATHLSPFLARQPPGADVFGAVARDPSYLYQYLMSFPYRLIELFTHDQTIQVIILRFINIALFASSLPLFRKLLKKTGASDLIINVCFIFFVLLPVVPLLAAQINYDNLVVPVTALALLMTINFSEELEQKKRVNFMKLGELAIVCLLGSLVKYAFLPIFLTIVIFLSWRLWSFRKKTHNLRQAITAGYRHLKRWSTIALGIGLLLSVILFGQRYAINVVRYHTPLPSCDQVLTTQQCSAYGPWIRDYNYKINKIATAPRSPITFTIDWFYGMWLRLFFAVDGPGTDFQTRGPLFLPGVGAIVFFAAGVLFLVFTARRLWRRFDQSVLVLSGLAIFIYVAALWLDEYRSFLSTGQPVAINGRYLLPIMLPLILVLALAYAEFLRHYQNVRAVATYVMILCFMFGGGALTYILRSNDQWYWPSPEVQKANHVVKHIAGPITPGNSKPTAFLH